MLIGYNAPVPTEENYRYLTNKITQGLRPLGEEGLSWIKYGSYVRGEHVVGVSDIDSVLVFPHDVVIDKEFLGQVSAVFCSALESGNEMMRDEFQVAPIDAGTMRDGRFHTYQDEYEGHFDLEGQVAFGPDYRAEMKMLRLKK